MTVTEVARLFRTTNTTIRRLCEDKLLRRYRQRKRGRWLISRQSVIDYERRLRETYSPQAAPLNIESEKR